jgi:cytoskeletal protein RodZ
MTKGTFGESLKREREMRGVSLDEISGATRIATRFLQAIENEQWDQLPGGVFNRGFVRAVARYLGLDEENTVAEYVLAVGDRPSVPVWTGSPPAVAPDQLWMVWVVAAVVIIALLAGTWVGVRRISAWRAARKAAKIAVTANAAPSSESSLTPADAVPAVASTNVAPDSAGPTTPNEATSGSGTPDSPQTSATSSAATTPVPVPFELKVAADKKTKVTVAADDNRVFDGTMKAGEGHTFTATDRFEISARDAGALVIELNGKTIAPIGPLGHAGKVTLTREALKGAPGGEN